MNLSRRRDVVPFALALVAVGSLVGAQSVRQITHNLTDVHVTADIDDSGNRIVMISSGDPLGTNPSHTLQLFGWDLTAGTTRQVTSFPEGVGGRGDVAGSVAISDDGETVAFISPADPLGLNPDGSLEIFTVGFDGTGIAQLTSVPSPAAGTIWSLALAGSGSHVAFIARFDPLGTNPSLARRVFKIETDGSSLEQVGSDTPSQRARLSISDDGAVVVFRDDSSAIRVAPSGGPVQTVGTGEQVVLSGDGKRVTYADGNITTLLWQDPSSEIVTGWWGCGLTMTDDGKFIYFDDCFGSVYRLRAEGSEAPLFLRPGSRPRVSGSNVRVVSARPGDVPEPYLANGGYRWDAYATDGTGLHELTDTELDWRVWQPSVSADGQWLAVLAGRTDTIVGFGEQYDSEFDAYSMRSDGSWITRLTPSAKALKPVISPDGTRVVVQADHGAEYTVPPGDGVHLYGIDIDGTNLIQLTPNGSEDINFVQAVTRDNERVVLFSTAWEIGGEPGQLYVTSLDGGPLHQFTTGTWAAYGARLDAADEWAVYWSQTNYDGLNPNTRPQVLRARTDGSAQERITTGTLTRSLYPDVSGDGQRIVYISDADPLGGNPDGNDEVFLYEVSTGATTQLTSTSDGDQTFPEITLDGQWVYFLSSSSLFEPRTHDRHDLYRLHVDSGLLERAMGFADPRGALNTEWIGRGYTYSVADDGDVFLAGPLDASGTNPDFSWEVWHIDHDRAPRFSIGAGVPTIVSWEADPRYVRYDLVRGDVDQLAAGAGETDLGDVICIADDTPRPFLGLDDPEQPAPGQAFFYLYRGSQGVWDGPGSYGPGASGPRVPSSGHCPS